MAKSQWLVVMDKLSSSGSCQPNKFSIKHRGDFTAGNRTTTLFLTIWVSLNHHPTRVQFQFAKRLPHIGTYVRDRGPPSPPLRPRCGTRSAALIAHFTSPLAPLLARSQPATLRAHHLRHRPPQARRIRPARAVRCGSQLLACFKPTGPGRPYFAGGEIAKRLAMWKRSSTHVT